MFKIRWGVALSVLMLLCSACSTTEKIDQPQNSAKNNYADPVPSGNDSVNTDSNRYKATLATHLNVDASVEVPDKQEIPILEVAEAAFDEKQLLPIFLGSEEVNRQNNDGQTDYNTSSGKTLRIITDSGSFQFSSLEGEYINTILNNINGMTAFKSKELDSMTVSEATKQIVDILNKLKITPHQSPQVYALDFNTLQQEQDVLLQDKNFKYFVDLGKTKLKEKWNKEDESYYLVFKVDMNGIPCTPTGYTLQSSEVRVPGSEVRAIVSKSGVLSFEINGSIYREQRSKSEIPALISMSEALDRLKSKYDTVILNDELTVTAISMMYVPQIISSKVDSKTGVLLDKKMEMIPAWCFNIEQKYTKGKEVNKLSIVVNINAVTGEEIH